MNEGWSRRQLLKRLVATAGSLLLPPKRLLAKPAPNPGKRWEIQIFSISPHTFRLSILSRSSGQATKVPDDGSLIKTYWGGPVATLRGSWRPQTIRAGNLQVHASPEAFRLRNRNDGGEAHPAHCCGPRVRRHHL
jgi:hypothetical protein